MKDSAEKKEEKQTSGDKASIEIRRTLKTPTFKTSGK